MKPRSSVVASFLAVGLAPAALFAQTPPFGAEFQVSTSYVAFSPSIASYGGFEVGWTGSPSEYSYEIFGRHFGPTFSGGQFEANTDTSSEHVGAAVSAGGGGFVVVWESNPEDGSDAGIFGQRFSLGTFGSAVKTGPEFAVNSYTLGYQDGPQVGGDAAGNFVVVWYGAGPGDDDGIFGQRFDATGSPVGGEFLVNASTTGDQIAPSLAVNPDGSFVVAWNTVPAAGASQIRAERFDASGTPVGPEFQVNTDSVYPQSVTRVASDRLGNFVVVWVAHPSVGPKTQIAGQLFNSGGERIGTEFLANTDTANSKGQPAVAVDPSGDFVVVWSDFGGEDGNGSGVFGQRFDRTGRMLGSEFQVNATTAGDQDEPAVLKTADGVTAVWISQSAPYSVVGRKQAFLPGAMKVDAHSGTGTSSDMNGVLEPGEAVLVETQWSRTGLVVASVPLTGTAANLKGPSGPVYLINQASADFGNVGGGTPPNCYDATAAHTCYVVSVAGARPAVHWDATFEEDISAGGGEPRTLHIGDSFSDVPRSEPFYAKIETVLHAGIASGCGGTKYCPGDEVSRDQMAIFIARGIAGSGERVPSAGTLLSSPYSCTSGGHSLFTDVAPTDPACKSVHYLGVQNVTLGCGVAMYCPSTVVTRDAMASFIAKAIVAPQGGNAVPLSYGPDGTTGLSYSCDSGSPNLHFTDVPVTNTFCKHIHYLWARGIVSGCTATTYCPGQTVTRDAMAKFLANGFGLQLYGP